VIAEGAAAIAFHAYVPFLTRPVLVGLADGTAYPVFDRDTVVPVAARRELTLFCTDNRDGEARLIVGERTRENDPDSIRQHVVVRVPVSPDLPKPYNHERVYASFEVDDDLVLRVRANGATLRQEATAAVHDLKFGLRVK
jgi:hypothetical protein